MATIRLTAATRPRSAWVALLLASSAMTATGPARAADASQPAGVQEVIVTAQKREENVQKVPMSIQVLGTKKLEQLQVSSFDDYAKYLPSVSYQTAGPGFAQVYFRGVASGENGNHSGPLPSTGVYLDEQPITTIGGALDIHVYDIARVEALAGPQGTLYGASSEAGTLRIITNKPQIGSFSGAYDVEVNQVDHGGLGYIAEGFTNIPVNDKMAVRLVGWYDRDAGYIDNVAGTNTNAGIVDGVRTYPTASAEAGMPITHSNAALVKNDYNDVETYGGRAALKIDLNDNWTITPSLIAQKAESHGNFSYDPAVGDLELVHFLPEWVDDRWYQAAMTVEGKIGDFNLTYAGSYLDRRINSHLDYSDYSFFYDSLFGSTVYDASGNVIDPTQGIWGLDHFTKQSHELRISSPSDQRLRFIGGLFYQRQSHFIQQRYVINGLSPDLSITGWPDTIWLTEELRLDRDYAAFGEASFDITPNLTVTGGIRGYIADNSLLGFAGLRSYENPVAHGTHPACEPVVSVGTGPCTNVGKSIYESGETHKINLTYKFDDQRLIYATWSTGFRPGGVNRNPTLPGYNPDYLTNYEIGWKTAWLDHALLFNGALFWERWTNIQFSTIPPGSNGLTQIFNAGDARILGVETDVSLRPDPHWSFTAAATYTDAQLTKDYCLDPSDPTSCAASGTQLPITPKFKANGTARYEFPLASLNAHVQGSVIYQSSAWPALIDSDRAVLGKMPGYATADFALGVDKDNWSLELALVNAFDERGQNDRFDGCATEVCSAQVYITPIRPRLVSLKFGQKF